jgi:hypothetical protein
MSINLTAEQQEAVRGGAPVRVRAEGIGQDVVLLRADQFDELREEREDLLLKREFRAAGVRSAARWLSENQE